jgi:putative hemolysin
MKRSIIALFGTLVAIGAIYLYVQATKPDVPKSGVINSVEYTCAGSRTIQALYFSDKVELTLSDGSSMLLNQAISASGARYANSDESFVFWNKGATAFVVQGDVTTYENCIAHDAPDTISQLANPASENCATVGGTLTIEKRGDGGEYGLCHFDDNRACEEWALMGGDCPVGGRKTTGYDTIDQNYCAWIGGETLAEPNSLCTINGKSECTTLDLYNGACTPV